MQSFINQVIDTLWSDSNALERGIHGYFPFSQRGRRSRNMSSTHRRYTPTKGMRGFVEEEDGSLWFGDGWDRDRATSSPRSKSRMSTRIFLRDALRRISHPHHPLHFLVVPRRLPNGRITYDWRKTTRITARGRRQTGRYDYQGHETGPIVQVGHQGAFAAGVPQRLMLEDAGLNQRSGQTIESKRAYSFKDAVVIDGVPVDVASAQQWERLGLLRPRGIVARSLRILAPLP